MRRDEQARHNRKVARIQYASGRLLWCNRVAVRSLKVRLQLAPVAFAPGAIVVGTPAANMVALAARTVERTVFPPERMDRGLALFGVEELMHMGEHRHG